MKHIPNIIGGLLGVAFIAFSLMYFLKLMPDMPPPPAGSPPAMFMGAFGPTGYMDFVKACELIGGILCTVPLTRNIGLLFLGPVILNIIAFHLHRQGHRSGRRRDLLARSLPAVGRTGEIHSSSQPLKPNYLTL